MISSAQRACRHFPATTTSSFDRRRKIPQNLPNLYTTVKVTTLYVYMVCVTREWSSVGHSQKRKAGPAADRFLQAHAAWSKKLHHILDKTVVFLRLLPRVSKELRLPLCIATILFHVKNSKIKHCWRLNKNMMPYGLTTSALILN